MKKNTLSLSFKHITIVAAVCVILLSVSLFAANQSKKSYRSVTTTTTIGQENIATSFNANKIEEHGECKIVVSNTCGKDVFIPTNTSTEWTAFKDHHPACIQLADCPSSCVLKQFVNGVYDGTIQHSKMRNALATFTNDEEIENTNYYDIGNMKHHYNYGEFVVGYGEHIDIALKTGYDGRPKIVSKNSIVATGMNDYSGFNFYEFELYGITPDTENTNRGCFADGSYWVNSNVYSRQTLQYTSYYQSPIVAYFSGSFTTTRFGGTIGVNFGLHAESTNSSYNRFFGCKSELLPNPDKYCVERIVPKAGTSASKPTAIYLKEFTNNANFGYAGCTGSGDDCLAQRNTICTQLTGIANTTFQTFSTGSATTLLPMIAPTGLSNNTGFIYRNTTGANYGSQIFGFYRYSSSSYFPFVTIGDGVFIADIVSSYGDNYYNYHLYDFIGGADDNTHASHSSRIGYNQPPDTQYYSNYGIKIPLFEINNKWVLRNVPLDGSILMTNAEILSYFGTGHDITKYVCVAHTCGPCYTPTANGCEAITLCEPPSPEDTPVDPNISN